MTSSPSAQLAGNPQQTAVVSAVLSRDDALALLDVVVASGRFAFIQPLLDAQTLSVTKLRLDGRDKNYDTGQGAMVCHTSCSILEPQYFPLLSFFSHANTTLTAPHQPRATLTLSQSTLCHRVNTLSASSQRQRSLCSPRRGRRYTLVCAARRRATVLCCAPSTCCSACCAVYRILSSLLQLLALAQ